MTRAIKKVKTPEPEEPDFRKIVEGSLAAHAVIHEQEIVFCNPAFETLTGYTRDELLAMATNALSTLICSEQLDLVEQLIRLCRDSGQLSYLPEVCLSRKGGIICWMEINLTPLAFRGKFAVHLCCVDRTARKQLADLSAHTTLLPQSDGLPQHDPPGRPVADPSGGEGHAQQRGIENGQGEYQENPALIIEYTRDGIALSDEEGAIVAWNRGLESITGVNREAVMGKALWETLYSLTCSEHRSPVACNNIRRFHEDLLSGGVLKSYSVSTGVIQTVDNARKTVELEFFIIHTPRGHRVGVIVSDSTRLTALSETLQKTEERIHRQSAAARKERQDFFCNLSARLRSPVNHISGLSSLLLTTVPLSKKQRECATAIQSSVEKLLRIIEGASRP